MSPISRYGRQSARGGAKIRDFRASGPYSLRPLQQRASASVNYAFSRAQALFQSVRPTRSRGLTGTRSRRGTTIAELGRSLPRPHARQKRLVASARLSPMSASIRSSRVDNWRRARAHLCQARRVLRGLRIAPCSVVAASACALWFSISTSLARFRSLSTERCHLSSVANPRCTLPRGSPYGLLNGEVG